MKTFSLGKVFLVLGLAGRKMIVCPSDFFLSLRMALWVVLVLLSARLASLPRTQEIAAYKIRARPIENSLHTAAKLGKTIDSLLGVNLFMFRPNCWARAMVLHRFLALNGIESRINFGVRKESGKKVAGHAWLEHDGQPLLEDNAAEYVVTFSLPLQAAILRPASTRS